MELWLFRVNTAVFVLQWMICPAENDNKKREKT